MIMIGEASGRIRLTLNESPTRYVRGTPNDGVITILDDDTPELRISTDVAITEDDNVNAIFVITAKVSPNKPIDVQYEIAESQNFIDVEGPNKSARLDFSEDVVTRTISIPIINDGSIENNGTIIATLSADTVKQVDYLVGESPFNSATVTVYDDDSPPTISIDAGNGEVFERNGTTAGIATFNLSATGFTQTTTLSIDATAAEVDGDYLPATTPTSYSVEFSDSDGDNTYRGVLSVPLDNDTTGEATAEVMVTLDANPLLYRLGSITTGKITVYDDDAPELILSTTTESVTESFDQFVVFVLTAKISPNKIVDLRYNLVENKLNGKNFIADEDEGNGVSSPLDFRNGITEVRLPFAILDDNVVKNGGEVSIEVIDDTADPITYTKSTTLSENSITIGIADDDRIRQLIVPESSGSVSEADGMASFNLMLKRVPGPQLFGVYATLTEEEGDFLIDSITNIERQYMVQFNGPDDDNIYHGILTIPLDDDSTAESTGKIKLTINNDTNDEFIDYKIVAPDQNSEKNTENIITVYDNDVPELSVSAVNATITEADNVSAEYLITARFSPRRELDVRYNLTESQDFISLDGNGQALLDFTNGKTEARISIPIDNDSDTDGTLTLTLRNDDSNPIKYTPALAPKNAATVNIEAEETLPLITISGPTTLTVESTGIVNFIVTATTDLGDDVNVRFDPSEVDSGNFLDETAATNQEEITSAEIDFTGSGDSYTATLPVPIHNDAIGERTGQIEVTLLSDDALDKTYRVATDGTQVARATILDDNAPELEITAGNPVTEDDNTTADFVITVTGSGHFIDSILHSW